MNKENFNSEAQRQIPSRLPCHAAGARSREIVSLQQKRSPRLRSVSGVPATKAQRSIPSRLRSREIVSLQQKRSANKIIKHLI